jgi:uncharacterized protein YaiL (DUF2058 family)
MGDLREELLRAGLVMPRAVEEAASPPLPADPTERQKRARQLMWAGKLGGKQKGSRRWYYVRGEAVRHIDLDAASAQELEKGELGLFEDPTGQMALVDRAAALELVQISPEWAVCFTGDRPPA